MTEQRLHAEVLCPRLLTGATRFASAGTSGGSGTAEVCRSMDGTTFGRGRCTTRKPSGRACGSTSASRATTSTARALGDAAMPGARWLEGASVNYARHLLAARPTTTQPPTRRPAGSLQVDESCGERCRPLVLAIRDATSV